jgi:hypothetical protein
MAIAHPYAITNTAGPPANMHANITGASAFNNKSATITIRENGAEIASINKYGHTESYLTMVDLQKDVFNISIDTLINLWVTRFGNEWVDLETIDNDDFFVNAYKRLKQLGHLEQHYLTDRAKYVCRKPE